MLAGGSFRRKLATNGACCWRSNEAELERYRMSSLVPLMPDFYVGDPAALEKYVDGARKMSGLVGAFTSKFGLSK